MSKSPVNWAVDHSISSIASDDRSNVCWWRNIASIIILTKAILLAAMRNTINHSNHLCSTRHFTLWRMHSHITWQRVSSNRAQQPQWEGKQSSTSYSRALREQQQTLVLVSRGFASSVDLTDAGSFIIAWPLLLLPEMYNENGISGVWVDTN